MRNKRDTEGAKLIIRAERELQPSEVDFIQRMQPQSG